MLKNFPDEEKYGLSSDMRRSENSILHNIAEGFGRFESKDKTRFYKISRGSAYEFISQTLVVHSQNYISESQRHELVTGYAEIIDELDLLIKSVETRGRNK